MSTWKPGEIWVAIVRSWTPGECYAVRYDSGWFWLEDSDYFINDDEVRTPKHEVQPLRPLAVIDYEDAEAVERLAEALYVCGLTVDGAQINPTLGVEAGFKAGMYDRVAEALREFAQPTPPKPEEPLGLGAVVEDADGRKWLRYPGMFSEPWSSPDLPSFKWSDIAAVKVLSEGLLP